MYYHLEEFFTTMLGVRKPDIALKYIQLAETARQGNRAQVKSQILELSALRPSESELKIRNTASIFPVRAPNGDESLCSASVNFLIIDHPKYETAFSGKLKVLDFPSAKFPEIRAFLEACKLQHRYISNTVVEESTVSGSLECAHLTRAFRSKAYQLFRYVTMLIEALPGLSPCLN